jgi:protein-tyrosine-phosphatase
MSLSLDTIITVASLVRGAVDLYNRIDDWPEQMKKLGRRIQNLNVYLTELEALVADKPKSAFARLLSTQKRDLGILLQDIRKVTENIKALFHKWENDIGPLGVQFRFKTLTQAYFVLGSSSDKITALIEEVNEHLQGIRDWLTLLGLKAALLIGEAQSASGAPAAPVLGKPAKAPVGDKTADKDKRKPSPSPSPAPVQRKDFKIIFVDPQNIARSVVGEALCKLLKEWTKVSKGDWRIQTIHSAGLLLKDRTDLPEIQGLTRDVPGHQNPVGQALDAVFDNKAFDFPAKKDVHIAMLKKRSNGIHKDMFMKYDFILVFTSRDHESVLKIKSTLIEKEGAKEVTARGKGRVLHLGSYLTLDGIPREIADAKQAGGSSKATRADWNWKVAQIKVAIKEFLKQEMQWKQPPQKASEAKLDTVVLLKQNAEAEQPPPKIAGKGVPEGKDTKKGGNPKKNESKMDGAKTAEVKALEKKGHNAKQPDQKQVVRVEEKYTTDKKPVDSKASHKKPDDKKAQEKKGMTLEAK